MRTRPVGEVTRGTTNPNRLRRVDRWAVGFHASLWRIGTPTPYVVDLGYGRSGVTAVELYQRLRAVRPDVRVIGLEIDTERVAAAQHLAHDGLSFARGGFELPLPGGAPARFVRAFNVLRQYEEEQVAAAWALMQSRLDDEGIIAEGTCDELGRVASWVELDRHRPRSLTISVALGHLDRPSDVAPRLPKALIHRNVPGERVYDWLRALDAGWDRAAGFAGFGRRQRFVAAVRDACEHGWPVVGRSSRWRLGEVTVPWSAVAPR